MLNWFNCNCDSIINYLQNYELLYMTKMRTFINFFLKKISLSFVFWSDFFFLFSFLAAHLSLVFNHYDSHPYVLLNFFFFLIVLFIFSLKTYCCKCNYIWVYIIYVFFFFLVFHFQFAIKTLKNTWKKYLNMHANIVDAQYHHYKFPNVERIWKRTKIMWVYVILMTSTNECCLQYSCDEMIRDWFVCRCVCVFPLFLFWLGKISRNFLTNQKCFVFFFLFMWCNWSINEKIK